MKAAPGVALALFALALGACGGGIVRLDPRNPTLPPQSRLWIAGAEDAVVIARANVEEATLARAEVDRWAADLRARVTFGDAAFQRLKEGWIQARTAQVQRRLDLARAILELALARQDVANAEVAVAHDLGAYELEPLRARTEAAAARVGELRADVRQSRTLEEQASTRFWQAYGRFAQGGGDTSPFWTTGP